VPRDFKPDKIINSIIIHRRDSENGNYKNANKHFKIFTKEMCKILNQDKSFSILTELLKNEHPEVRSAAAYFLLPYDKKTAEKALASLFKEGNGIGFNARMIMKEWKKGTLKFPSLADGRIIFKEHL